jgi:hypothetical protein
VTEIIFHHIFFAGILASTQGTRNEVKFNGNENKKEGKMKRIITFIIILMTLTACTVSQGQDRAGCDR